MSTQAAARTDPSLCRLLRPVLLFMTTMIWPELAMPDSETAREVTELPDQRVVARHRSEAADDIPMAISVADGGTLEALQLRRTEDMQALLPGLNVGYVDPRQTSFAVRGIGNNPVNENLEASVGLYLDNVYLGQPGMAVFDLMDIEQIELLRGPQGTLFGKNATAGILHIRTRAPSFSPSASVELSGGDRNDHQLRATASGPLGHAVAGSVALYRSRDDGWLRNLHNGELVNQSLRQGARTQLLYEPSPGASLRLIADYQEESGSQGALVITGVGPAPSGYRNLIEAMEATGSGPLPLDPSRYEVNIDGEQALSARLGGLSAQLELDVGSHRLSSISAWRFWNYAPTIDADRSPASIYRDVSIGVRHRQWSQEWRLASPPGPRFDYVMGMFLYRQDFDNEMTLSFGDDADAALLPFPFHSLPLNALNGIYSLTDGNSVLKSGALFAQGTWHLRQDLDLTAGLRLTHDRRHGRTRRAPPRDAQPTLLPPINAARQQLVGEWDSDEHGGLRDRHTSPSGLLALSWRRAREQLLYLSLAQSEKSSGFNVTGVGSGAVLGIDSLYFDAERARSVEAGIKQSLYDGRVDLSTNLFLTRVSGYQTSAIIHPSESVGPVGVLTNVGKIGSRGVEWAFRTLPARGFELVFNGAWIDARFRDFDNAPCPSEANPEAPVYCDRSGDQLQNSPRWTLNTRAHYHWRWSARLRQNLDLAYAWRSSRDGTLDGSRFSHLPAYGLLHAATTFTQEQERGRATVSLWGYNLLDKSHLLGAGSISPGETYSASAGRPRTVGVTLGYHFH